MTAAQLADNKELKGIITILTVGFFVLGIWNIWETHKYRKLDYELKLKHLDK